MNPGAGRGELLIIKLRVGDAEAVPFAVDTGSPITLVDKSLEPRLGKKGGTDVFWNLGIKHRMRVFAAPALYCGTARLATGSHCYSFDFDQLEFSHEPAKKEKVFVGILGMDCLKHYCLQLDFEAGKMRILDRPPSDLLQLGKAFPLLFGPSLKGKSETVLPYCEYRGLMAAENSKLLIDTGCNIDGFLLAPLFKQQLGVSGTSPALMSHRSDTSDDSRAKAFFPECTWNGESYTNLVILGSTKTGPNIIGLRFLARHLVTLDFPRQTMYLKKTSVGPLAQDALSKKVEEALEDPLKLVSELKQQDQLPFCSRTDEQRLYCCFHPEGDTNRYTFVYQNSAEVRSLCYYGIERDAKVPGWKLRQYWRGNESAH